MAKHRGYSTNLRFLNAPSITAQVPMVAPDGRETVVPLTFNDDDARAIFEMIPNPAPGGTGTIATGRVNDAALDAAISARIAEAGAPAAVADLLAAADKARLVLRDTQAKQASLEAEIVSLESRAQLRREELVAANSVVVGEVSAKDIAPAPVSATAPTEPAPVEPPA